MIGAYSTYQTQLSNNIIHLKDSGELTFKSIAKLLVNEGYVSPRGFDLSPESVFSIYKKRKIRDARLLAAPIIKISEISIVRA